MPNAPQKKKRPWVAERKPFEREQDNSWFYNDWRWRKFSARFKREHPLCEMKCKDLGIITASTVTDHIHQYTEGGPGWNLNDLKDKDFQAGCDACHNSRSGKQAHGYKGK